MITCWVCAGMRLSSRALACVCVCAREGGRKGRPSGQSDKSSSLILQKRPTARLGIHIKPELHTSFYCRWALVLGAFMCSLKFYGDISSHAICPQHACQKMFQVFKKGDPTLNVRKEKESDSVYVWAHLPVLLCSAAATLLLLLLAALHQRYIS